jgi:hypothetical protein
METKLKFGTMSEQLCKEKNCIKLSLICIFINLYTPQNSQKLTPSKRRERNEVFSYIRVNACFEDSEYLFLNFHGYTGQEK